MNHRGHPDAGINCEHRELLKKIMGKLKKSDDQKYHPIEFDDLHNKVFCFSSVVKIVFL